MRANQPRRPRPLLNAGMLSELALSYVGRFATTRAKLCMYLDRKIRERGWEGDSAPDLQAIAESFAERGYIDDSAYALSRSRALTGRGYGIRRVAQSLRSAGVEDSDSVAARELALKGSVEAALRFAERRRIGPFATREADNKARERGLAALIRAGHGFAIARAIVNMPAGAKIDPGELGECVGLPEN